MYTDYKDIDSALSKVEDITNHINERQREIENMSQCLQIQEKLRGLKINLVEPHRKFHGQFAFNLQKGKKLILQQFCVFSDYLIITDDKWKVMYNFKMRSVNIDIIDDEINGKGFELTYLKQVKVYFDTNETMNDDVDEIEKICSQNRLTLINNDMSLFDAGQNAVKHEMTRIDNDLYEKKVNAYKQLRNGGGNLTPSTGFDDGDGPIARSRTMPLPEKHEDLWGRSLKLEDNNVMNVEWKFVDENNDKHCVMLQHYQIKGSPNKKTKRSIKIDNVEKFKSNRSSKTKWKYDLNNKKKNKKQVTLNINIEYDSKKSKYKYPLLINGKSYPEAFREWQAVNKK